MEDYRERGRLLAHIDCMKIRVYIIFFLYFCLKVPSYGQIISTIAGGGMPISGNGDGGLATNASIGFFGCAVVDVFGNIFIADPNNHRVRKVDRITNIITTIAGNGMAGYNGDAIAATSAQLNFPNYLTTDKIGNLYIQDPNNNRIRKVDKLTGIITTYAGNGMPGYNGDNIAATTANILPGPIAFDLFGNLLIADVGNRRIRKISSLGIITTLAGNGMSGNSGDGGPATAASINIPLGLCTDEVGNIFFQDSSQSVRKIDISTGKLARVAGRGDNISSPYTGDGNLATSVHICPYGIATDKFSNLFIADACNERIEIVFANSGHIYTVAGCGVNGYSGDGGLATAAKLKYPENVSIDTCGNLYIVDFGNKVVRKVTFPKCHYLEKLAEEELANSKLTIGIYPNPTNQEVHLENVPARTTYQLCNLLGSVMQYGTLKEGVNIISVMQLPAGLYMLLLMDEEGKRTVHKIVKE